MFKFISDAFHSKSKMSDDQKDVAIMNALATETSLPMMLNLAPAKRVMVFAPHPDDECIGCGGALALLAQNPEVQISVVLVTNGDGGEHSPDVNMGPRRLLEMQAALKVLGVSELKTMGRLDGRFELDDQFETDAQQLIQSFQPNWVFLPGPMDYHKDHLLVSKGVESACKEVDSVEQLVYFETWTPLPATHVLDITSVMDLKCRALQAHHSALKYGDYERGVKGLNAYRGLYLGFDRFAEAFVVQTRAEFENPSSWLTQLKGLGLSLKSRLGART